MKYVMILAILTLSACGSSDQQPGGDATVNFPYRAITQPEVLGDRVDFTNLSLNSSQASDTVIPCSGSFGNNGSVNGVANGQVRITGTTTHGTIQFGNVAHVGATDSRCHDISKEAYSYDIKGLNMTVCLVNLAYPYCTTYTVDLSQ